MVRARISHRARMENCLSRGHLDRPPVALWRHFPVDDQTPEGLANSVLKFQNDYDFDLVKVTPASSYCIKDWGVKDFWNGNPEGTRDYANIVVQNPEDWQQLPHLNPRAGVYGEHLTCLKLIRKELGDTTPFIQTIFSPLAQAKHLCGPDGLIQHLRDNPTQLHKGLQTITATTINFINECQNTGISGIFYAIQHAQKSLLTKDEYLEFGRPYDIQILNTAKNLWLNILHLHGTDVYFDLAADYPVQVINWHDRETSYSLSEGKQHTPAVVCGGLRQWKTLVLGTPDEVIYEGRNALEQTNSKSFILGTGCVLPVIAPHGNIMAARRVVEL